MSHDLPNDAGGHCALVVSGLQARVGHFMLGPVSFSLRTGDHLVLMGASGCGKTTLLRCLLGLVPGYHGEIWIDSNRADLLPARKRRMGYVPQFSYLFPHMTVASNVSFGLRYTGLPPARQRELFDRAVELTGISALLGRYPHTLSGGEARRVALARAIAIAPPILLLDEPLSMLDTNSRNNLLRSLLAIRNEYRTATLHVTHHVEEAAAIATRILLMADGKLTGDLSGTASGRQHHAYDKLEMGKQ
ncbi:MAG: ATP-binding cassette domain-containing protein [Kiritimatiellae bacterium]|nr:ATP-binding cassette domain-containing protein [Kiritimatiellia bacterium]